MFPSDTKFLIVDDFPTMRKLIKKLLNELGYLSVEEADDGQTAFPVLKEAADTDRPFGFVISDWNMPLVSGIDLLKACKADPKLKSVPFILITADSEQKQIVEAAKAGVSEYVVKPFNAATLKQKLERVHARLAQRQAMRAS